MNFTQEELTTIYRWAEYEERTAPALGERARRIKAKVSRALAATPSVMPETATKTAQPG